MSDNLNFIVCRSSSKSDASQEPTAIVRRFASSAAGRMVR